jgi:hypothetical protein
MEQYHQWRRHRGATAPPTSSRMGSEMSKKSMIFEGSWKVGTDMSTVLDLFIRRENTVKHNIHSIQLTVVPPSAWPIYLHGRFLSTPVVRRIRVAPLHSEVRMAGDVTEYLNSLANS